MDAEVKRAQRHQREREQAVWNRVEQIGRQARATDTAAQTEKPAAVSKADEDEKRARMRQSA